MDKMTGDQQIRAIALEAASRIVTENLLRLTGTSNARMLAQEAKAVTVSLAGGFEEYLKGPVEDARRPL